MITNGKSSSSIKTLTFNKFFKSSSPKLNKKEITYKTMLNKESKDSESISKYKNMFVSSRPRTATQDNGSPRAQDKVPVMSLKEFLESSKRSAKRFVYYVPTNRNYVPITFARRLKLHKNSAANGSSVKRGDGRNFVCKGFNDKDQASAKIMSVVNLQINNTWNVSLIPKKHSAKNYQKKSAKSHFHSIRNATAGKHSLVQDSPSNFDYINCKGTKLRTFGANYSRNVHTQQAAYRTTFGKGKSLGARQA
eukprot:TRINITY_DN12238_c0_g6_i1.p1 TRINITY_DN12238_c0_g6~~TRINITY_DN12238_c0_g6_i1.p1  ORF type:complete len:261 (+),score=53.83 TRINITY_DN12238_c0_g6_i1:35-784(+)